MIKDKFFLYENKGIAKVAGQSPCVFMLRLRVLSAIRNRSDSHFKAVDFDAIPDFLVSVQKALLDVHIDFRSCRIIDRDGGEFDAPRIPDRLDFIAFTILDDKSLCKSVD